MSVVRRRRGWKVRGGDHAGWLPVDAATPLPAPVREVTLEVQIEDDGAGCLLLHVADDRSTFGDTWHETLEAAEKAALEDFGLRPSDWESGGDPA